MKIPQSWSRLLIILALALLIGAIPLSVSASGVQSDTKRSGVTIKFYDPNAPPPDYDGSATPDDRKVFDFEGENMGPGGGFGNVSELPVGIPQVTGNVSMVKSPASLGDLPKTGGGALPGYLLMAGGVLLILSYGIGRCRRRQSNSG